ncbi:SGNH/GDSL hydrolase family protein [Litoreibacter janthinus]|uniref:Phospholipase/lecithinase/hemolysin n=1 Tax=Litoreibacter janthinus TaxID=670154 RepID=A0A1I6FV37_9RHOB|nr:SGNH/GDSL hydrolase family protein [Litoreibacter janthinus]SFR33687.1 Phospholipase/lecithinase/hemolysin [Litoreibacter janthinus]
MPFVPAPNPDQRYVFFGDSLSDDGNLYAASDGLLPDPIRDTLGGFGGRASNGPTYAEYIAALSGLGPSLNYAIAGGEAAGTQPIADFIVENGLAGEVIVGNDDPRLTFDMNLGAQVDRFSADVGSQDLSDVSAFVLVGANDYFAIEGDNIISAGLALLGTLDAAVDATIDSALELSNLGVGQVVISSLPSAGFIPGITGLGSLAVDVVDFLIDAHNSGLQNGVNSLVAQGIDAVYLDMEAMTAAIADDPTSFGIFAPLSLTLTSGDVAALSAYDTDQIGFWDSIHPSAATHGVLGAYTSFALQQAAVVLSGGDNAETLGGGNDLVLAYAGDDQVLAGGGDDIVFLGSGNDAAMGEAGADLISGGVGNDLIMGGAGNDILSGGQGNDVVEGGDGNDILIDGLGSDTLTGGEGDDVFFFFEDGLIAGSDDGLVDSFDGGNGQDALLLVLSQATVDTLVANGTTSEPDVFASLGLVVQNIEQIELVIGLEALDGLQNEDWYVEADIWGLL